MRAIGVEKTCHGNAVTSPTLVTGATGFIGRHIIRRLVGDGVPVVALARRRNGHSATARVAAALEPAGDGIDVVEGDLALPDLGLSSATLARLRRRVERVIHCAGDTTFSPHAVDAFIATLVDGPLTLLRALAGHRLHRWVHLSTAFVCGAREGVVGESEGDVGQRFHNAYERTQLESEAAVRSAATALEVDVRIVRPSIVVGSGAATPGARPSKVLFGLIRMAAALAAGPQSSARMRIPARSHIRFNFIPIEDLVRVVAVVAADDDAAGGTFHAVLAHPPTHEDLRALACQHLRLSGIELVATAALIDPSPLEREVARMLEPYRDYLERDVVFDDANARRVLARAGVPLPAFDPGAIQRLIAQALGG